MKLHAASSYSSRYADKRPQHNVERKKAVMDSGELTFLVLEWSMQEIGCQKVLLPQHQSTVSKYVNDKINIKLCSLELK